MERLVRADAIRHPQGHADDALLIRDGKVAAIGPASDLARPDLPEDAYPGCVVLPGLMDAHFHPVGYTASVTRLNVEGARDHADLVDRIRGYALERDPSLPIVGTRLNEVTMSEGRLPDRRLLDEAVSDRPLLLYRYDGHVAISNTAGLRTGHVTGSTPIPPGGAIEVDVHGQPTGVLKETAIDLVAQELGGRSSDLTPEEVLAALHDLRSMGLTRLGAIASPGRGLFCGGDRELELLCELGDDLPLYLDVLVIADDAAELEAAARLIDERGGHRLSFLGVKIFADGSFGGRTALMDEPFRDRPTTGVDRLDQRRHEDLARAALAMGGSVAIHAIGDRANANVLDLYRRMRHDGLGDDGRLRIEHASVLRVSDIERMAELGVTASIQPAFLGSEHDWIATILGTERLNRTYAFRTMLAAGVALAGGSDCPVEPPSPLAGIAAARHRYGVVESEGLTAGQALDLFTSGAAHALRAPRPLDIGSPANLTVLEDDPMTTSPGSLPSLRIADTWVDGRPD